MKKILVILILWMAAFSGFSQKILPKPNPIKFVNDNAGVLQPEKRQTLESKLKALSDTSSNQIVIVLISTLNDDNLEEYTHALFRSWGIGQKKKNNGVLIFAAMNDHKMRIEVGFGLEGAIPDVTAKSITGNDMKPFFKEGKYYEGLDSAVNDISRAAVGEYNESKESTPPAPDAIGKQSPYSKNYLPLIIFCVLFFGIFITIVMVIIRAAKKGSFTRGRNSYGGGYYSSSSDNDSGSSWSSSDSSSDSGSSDFGGGDSGGGGASDSW